MEPVNRVAAERMLLLRLAGRIRRRGSALLFFALIDLTLGSQFLLEPAQSKTVPLYKYADTIAPLQVWGVAWITVGVLCLVHAFKVSDRVAFAAATMLKVAYGLVAIFGWLLAGVPRGYLAAAVWIAFAGFVTIIATWPEADRRDTATSVGQAEAVVAADGAGVIVGWNVAATRLFGWPTSEIIGRPLTTLIPAHLLERHRAGFSAAARAGRSDLAGRVLRLSALRRDGSQVPVELTISVWDQDDGVLFTGLIREVLPGRAPRDAGAS